jgi:hypothetical protein
MTVDLRTVAVQRQVAEATVVQDGLKPDEIVVTDGQLRLISGSKVSIKSGPAANAKGQP